MPSADPAFVLHLPPNPAQLALRPLYDPYGDGCVRRFHVVLSDDGLTATTTATVAAFDLTQLDTFLWSLAEDWRGWDGIRSWRSLERELRLDATHDRTRRIYLGVTVGPRHAHDSCSWSARAGFAVEPGEQMATIANDVAALLGPPASRYHA